MLRLLSIKVPLDYTEATLRRAAARVLGVPGSAILSCRLARRSVDARRKNEICFVVSLDVTLAREADERRLAARLTPAQGGAATAWCDPVFPAPGRIPDLRPIVVGFGPAGMFAALALAEAGLRPIVLERGHDVDRRKADVDAYWQHGQSAFSPESNVQFGEGGAGTFSDGKLNTGTKDPLIEYVLRTLVRFGAPQEILTDAKPHIGTDKLADVVKALRLHVETLGGEVRFASRLTRLHARNGRISSVEYISGGSLQSLPAQHLVLAVGHSARDTFLSLRESGFTLLPKAFSVGTRIEHPQALIDQAQYGPSAGHPALPPADYKLSVHLANGRGVYTFCMCPGGEVVAAASEPDSVVTNGMSRYARDGVNANSALLVGVSPEDFPGNDPLAGMYFQRSIEQAAFDAAGRTGAAPAQCVGDFLAGGAPILPGRVAPSYRPGVVPCPMDSFLPAFVTASLREAIPLLDRHMHGFALADAVLTGPETRSSSPVRMPRDERTVSLDAKGLHPCGEGAGFAGGITSAAVDGLRCARAILEEIAQEAPR